MINTEMLVITGRRRCQETARKDEHDNDQMVFVRRGWTQVEKAVFYHFLYFFGNTFFLTPTVKVCDFKACIYLDTHFLLNCDVIYLIK